MADSEPQSQTDSQPPKVQGEGDYDAARRFRAAEERFVNSGEVEQKAREAEEAVEGPEGAELEAARHAAARGESLKDDNAAG